VPVYHRSRRHFIHAVGATGAGLCVGCSPATDLDVLSEDFEVRLSEHPDLATVGTSVLIDAGTLRPIAVTRLDAETFEVTGTECSHQHCGVGREGDGWRCPCHGARFDLDGTRRSGPAPVGLTSYDWTLDADVLTILAP
jgi:Rieske Fe-S protein